MLKRLSLALGCTFVMLLATQALGDAGTTTSPPPKVVTPQTASDDELLQRVRILELKAAEPADSKSAKTTVPLATAGIACFAVLMAALIGMYGQKLNAANAATIAANSLISATTLANRNARNAAKLAANSLTSAADLANLSAQNAATIAANSLKSAADLAARAEIERQSLARKAAEDTAELARRAAIHTRANQIMEFKLKRVELFYSPVFAALRQSLTLYDKLLEQLLRDEPGRYTRETKDPESDFRFFVIEADGQTKPFYLVDQLPAIRRHAGSMKLIDLMLDLGKSICVIITTHAGLASENLVEILGKYMAHHAILSAIREGESTTPSEPGSNKLGSFPKGLDKKIEEQLKALSREIDEYDRASEMSPSLLSGIAQGGS